MGSERKLPDIGWQGSKPKILCWWFREALEELQFNIDILEEKVEEMCEEVYDSLELQIKDLRNKLNAALEKLPDAKKWSDKLMPPWSSYLLLNKNEV